MNKERGRMKMAYTAIQRISRRSFLKGLGAGGASIFLGSRGGSTAFADDGQCPQVSGKTIRWIVPAPPGGGYDILSRLITPFYEKKLGAKIVINYLPGAGGIIGAKALRDADPNGLTLGLLDAPGQLVSALTAETEAPNPARDFTILGRIESYHIVWATRSSSPFRSIEDVIAEAQKRPILFGVTGVGSTVCLDIAVTSSLLGINAEFVAGYRGTREIMLALMRGEIDMVNYAIDTLIDEIEAGNLRPMLQVGCEPISPHPSLEGVPLLCGDDGLAARRAAEPGRNVEEAKADAAALVGLVGSGRLVVAPAGLEEGLFRCLEQKLHEALTDPGLKAAAAAARRSLEVARADAALAEVKTAAKSAEKFIPLLREAIKKTRR